MTTKEKIYSLKKWEKIYSVCNEAHSSIDNAFGDFISGKVYDAIWNQFDEYTKLLSLLLKDENELLSWYCWENNMGKDGLSVEIDGKKAKKIKSINDLLKLIESKQS